MKKNRILILVLTFAMCMSLLLACKNNDSELSAEGEKYSIVCTIFPEYDWVKEILGDRAENFELTLLLNQGVDLHSYQPTAADIAKIAACDLFIYVGGESDEWVEDALAEATNKDIQIIHLLDTLGEDAKEEEVVEGMEVEEEEEEQEEGPEYDEHVWLSLKNAKVFTSAICESLSVMDAQNADAYHANLKAYQSKLSDLDCKYMETIKAGTKNTILFGDRFPFRYLADDYSLNYYAAFVGCSAETEASFETITFLAGKMDELGLTKIFVLESSDQKIAHTVVQNTKDKNQDILVLDSMQSTTSKDIANGVTYLSIMENNLTALCEALQ